MHAPASAETGIASVYGDKADRLAWTATANGNVVDPTKLTAAHRTLPFGAMVRVTNLKTGKSIIVRINDRGPFKRGRIIDLTPKGAGHLGIDGLGPVTITCIGLC